MRTNLVSAKKILENKKRLTILSANSNIIVIQKVYRIHIIKIRKMADEFFLRDIFVYNIQVHTYFTT